MKRKPSWLKIKLPEKNYFQTRELIKALDCNTVCVQAKCPNVSHCWSKKTATFLILGKKCTRNCSFCNMENAKKGEKINEKEIKRIMKAVKKMKLNYVVITSPTRDDLSDKGARHYAKCIKELKKEKIKVEALIPDFNGEKKLIELIVKAEPEVIAHNLEVVKELQGIRDKKSNYEKSLKVLQMIKEINSKIKTKSSLMLGLGETQKQVINALKDLKKVKVDIITIGQYLRPSPKNLPVKRFISPKTFEYYRIKAQELGMKCISGPLIRSSFKAKELLNN